MKKIISIICAVCLVIAPLNVYATEIFGEDSAETTVTGHVDSQYCVLIPESIVADGTEYHFNASLMDLAEGEHVNITISGLNNDGKLSMTGGDGKGTVHFETMTGTGLMNSATIATFGNGETVSSDGFRAYLQAEKAGDYTGTVTFNISLSQD